MNVNNRAIHVLLTLQRAYQMVGRLRIPCRQKQTPKGILCWYAGLRKESPPSRALADAAGGGMWMLSGHSFIARYTPNVKVIGNARGSNTHLGLPAPNGGHVDSQPSPSVVEVQAI